MPCAAPTLPLPLPCPVSNFPFVARDRRRKLHRELFFFLLPRTGGGSYTGNGQCFFSFYCQGQEEEVTQGTGSVFFSFCCQGQEEEVTQGNFFPFAARDFFWDMGFRTWTDGQTDIVTLI